MEIMNINFSVKYDEDWDDKFEFNYESSPYAFTITEKLQLVEAIRKGLVDEELSKMSETLDVLKNTNYIRPQEDVEKLISMQSKILKEIQNARN